MNNRVNYIFVSLLALCCLISCSDNGTEEGGQYKPASYSVKGKVEKGPFISGSTINMQPMNEKLNPSGSTFSTTITDHAGNFTFNPATLDAPFAQLTANGYFFNEVTGELSKGTLSLRALANLAEQSTVNVNLLTHLKYARIIDLVEKDNKSYSVANKQAQKELLTIFGLQKYADTDAANYSITSGTAEAGALIAISSMILKNRSEAQVTEYLAKLSKEFGETGTFSVETKETIKNDRKALLPDLRKIEENIKLRYEELGQNVTVMPLEYYFDWNDDGIAGNEMYDPNDPPTLSMSEINVPKQGGEYTVNINSKVQLYIENNNLGGAIPTTTTSEESLYTQLYDRQNTEGSIEKSIEGNTLKIKVAQTQTKSSSTRTIPLYDYAGNTAVQVTIIQEGDPSVPSPQLGSSGKALVGAAFQYLASSMSIMSNYVNNYGNYNGSVWTAPLAPGNSQLYNMWASNYYAINYMLMLDQADKEREALFGAPVSLFNAIAYYNMVTVWGGVPYLQERLSVMDANIARTAESEILNSLESKLKDILPYLEERKNVYDNDINAVFFSSKDVARILLADIYMYRNEYTKAKPYLEEVASHNYYDLGSDNDIIMGYIQESTTRASDNQSVIPMFSMSDVLLSLAECENKHSNSSKAWEYAKKVASAKNTFANTTAPEDLLNYIAKVRSISLPTTVGRFAFLKRCGLAKPVLNLQDYQLLLPIPSREIMANSLITQNPGY